MKITVGEGETPELPNGKLKRLESEVDFGGEVGNGQAVISREDLILVPDPEQNYVGNNNLEVGVRLPHNVF